LRSGHLAEYQTDDTANASFFHDGRPARRQLAGGTIHGILTPMAKDLELSVGEAGQAVTATAVVAPLPAPRSSFSPGGLTDVC